MAGGQGHLSDVGARRLLPAPWTGLPAPWTGLPAPWTGLPAPWTGLPAPWTGLPVAEAARQRWRWVGCLERHVERSRGLGEHAICAVRESSPIVFALVLWWGVSTSQAFLAWPSLWTEDGRLYSPLFLEYSAPGFSSILSVS